MPTFNLLQQLRQRHVPLPLNRHRLLPQRGVDQHPPGDAVRDRPLGKQRLRPCPKARPFEPHGHDHAAVIRRRQIKRPVEQRVTEMRAFQIDADLQPGGADAVVVGVVDVEYEIEGAARQADPADGDLLQCHVRLGERQPAEGGAGEAEGGKGRQQAVEGGRGHSVFSSAALRLRSAHQSMRCLMSFSNPNSVGSYQLAPRNASGRYSWGAYACSNACAYLYPAPYPSSSMSFVGALRMWSGTASAGGSPAAPMACPHAAQTRVAFGAGARY